MPLKKQKFNKEVRMKNILISVLLFVLASCSTTRDKINESNEKVESFKKKVETDAKEDTEGGEKLKWFTILDTSQGTIAQEINKSIVKVSKNIYCEFEKEHKQGPFEKHPGFRKKWARCINGLEDFQLVSYCDKDNKIRLLDVVKKEEQLDFSLSIQCQLEK